MTRIFTIIAFSFLFLNVYSQDKIALNAYWDNALKLEAADKSFSVKIGGRIQYDVMFIGQDDSLQNHFTAENGTELRRARLYTSGTIYKRIQYKFQIDFAGNHVVIKDAYMRYTNIPGLGNITIGNFKEPRGFEMLTSSKYISFMERSVTNQFDNDRSLGLMFNNSFFNKNLSVYAGYFYPAGNNAKYSGNRYNITFRLVGLPYYNTENGYKIVHLGAGITHEYHNNEEASYASRPETHMAPKYLKVEMDAVESINEINGEFVIVYNSFTFQSEYTYAGVQAASNSNMQESNYVLNSFYGSLSWFATGEHKNYSHSKKMFGRVSPRKNFGNGGAGAIELAARYSVMNLNDHDLQGGKMSNLTFGVNWYLNPVYRISLNYVRADISELGIANIFQMRFQIAF